MNKPVAYGRKSEIYDVGDDKVLKLYCEGFPIDLVKREFESTKLVHEQTDLAIPKPLRLKQVDRRMGIVFEKISGIAYMDLFQKNPIKYFTKAGNLAEIHKNIHTFKVRGLPNQVDIFAKVIEQSPRLSKDEKQKLRELLEKTRDVRLCHGDFHHGNVVLSNEKRYILDWMDAFAGNPRLDIALTAVNAAVSDAPNHVPFFYRKLYDWLKKMVVLDRLVLNQHSEVKRKEWPEFLLLAAGIHLARCDGEYSGHRKYFELALSRYR